MPRLDAPALADRPATAPAIDARDPWLDNARFALIALVVFGHALEPLLDAHPLLDEVYRFVYLFHMPAFAFLSGAVARTEADSELLRGVVFRLLLPYALFQGLYALAAQAPEWPDDGPAGIATPYWLLWYLPSLACWRLLLPLFARLRHGPLLALALALAAGWTSDLGYYLSLSRTLVFFPFFFLGQRWMRPWRAVLEARRPALPAVLTLCVLALLASAGPADPRWLYGSVGYAALHVDPLSGALQRLLLMIAAGIATLAFLALVPRRRLPWSALGAGSLGAYLLHGFVVKLADGTGAIERLADWPRPLLLATLGLAALACTAALSSAPVNRALAPLAAPRWLERRLWRRPPQGSRRNGGR